MRPLVFLREVGVRIRKTVMFVFWLALGVGIIKYVAWKWSSLDTSYVDLPNASITLRQSTDWTIALVWRALLTVIAFFAVRGCWRKLKSL